MLEQLTNLQIQIILYFIIKIYLASMLLIFLDKKTKKGGK